jgi:hypothetical protein
VNVFGFQTGTDVLSDALQLDVDAVPLAVSVGTHFLLEWQHGLGRPVTLAHCYLLLRGRATVVSVLAPLTVVHIERLRRGSCVTIVRDSFTFGWGVGHVHVADSTVKNGPNRADTPSWTRCRRRS